MKSIFYPAICLANKLKYAQKFQLLSFVITSIIVFLIILLYQQLNKTIVDSTIQLDGVEQIVAVNDLIKLTQQYRGLSAADNNKNKLFSDQFHKKEEETNSAFYKLFSSLDSKMTLLQVDNTLELSHNPEDLANLWETNKANHLRFTIETEFNKHTHLIKQLQLLTVATREHYKLTTGINASSSYLIDVLITNIPETSENMGKIRAIVLGVLSNKTLSSIQQLKLISLESALTRSIADFQFNLTKIIQYSPKLAPEINLAYRQLVLAKRNIVQLLSNDIYNQQFSTSPTHFWPDISTSIDSLYGLMHHTIAPSINRHIERRIKKATLSLQSAIGGSLFLLLLALYFMIALYKALLTNINHINKTIHTYSTGNSTARIKLNTQDEIRDISIAVNNMADTINQSTKQLGFQQNALNQHAIVSITDIKGNITYANDKFAEISQYTLDELIGKNHRLLKSNFHSGTFFKEMWETISNGNTWHGEVQNKARDGSPYWVEATITPFLDAQGKPEQYIAIRTDITAAKLLEIKRDWVARKEKIRAEVSHSLQKQEPLKTRFEQVLAKLCQFEGLHIQQKAGVFLTKNNTLHMFAMHGKFSDEFILKEKCVFSDQCLCGKVLSNGLFKISDDCFTDHEHEHTFKGMQPHGHYIVPLNFAEKVMGVLFLYTEPYPSREPELLEMLMNIGMMMGLAIANETAQKALIKEKAVAETANKAKSEFLSAMSHELRTPLNAILGFAQLLESDEDAPLSNDQQESLGYILSSGQHLLSLINDVLELATIEAGKIELYIEPLQLTDVINDSLSLLIPLAKKAHLTIQVLSDTNITVNADYTKLKQVIINLVSNAIKYNRKNGSISLKWQSSDNNLVRINIIDTGIGISEENQYKVFDAFNRLGQENSTIEGTGIGLVVTKDLVTLMNGQIGFSSVENKGSTFWFELPITNVTEQAYPS